MPESAVSKAKLYPAVTLASISFNIKLAAFIAAVSDANDANPAAIKSALIKVRQSASFGRYSRAKVVLPAPLGPAIIIIFFVG